MVLAAQQKLFLRPLGFGSGLACLHNPTFALRTRAAPIEPQR